MGKNLYSTLQALGVACTHPKKYSVKSQLIQFLKISYATKQKTLKIQKNKRQMSKNHKSAQLP